MRLIGRLSSAAVVRRTAEVPKEIYESRPLREHELYARINNQWEVGDRQPYPFTKTSER